MRREENVCFYFVRTSSLFVAVSLAACLTVIAARQSADEADLRLLVERFFDAYQKKNIEAVMSMWDEKSPNFAAGKKSFQQTFLANDKIELKNLLVRELVVDKEKATLRVAVDLQAIDSKTGKPAIDTGKIHSTLRFIKGGGAWKVWQYQPTEHELAEALAQAKTDQDREALLASKPELMTGRLHDHLLSLGRSSLNETDDARTALILTLALRTAERLGDKVRIANSLRVFGNLYWYQDDYKKALEYYSKSLQYAEESGDQEAISNSLNNVAIIYSSRGDYGRAVEYLKRSLSIAEARGDNLLVARALNNIAVDTLDQHYYASAMDSFDRAFKVASKGGYKGETARALIGMGSIYGAQGNYIKALQIYQQALKFVNENNDLARTVNVMINTAGIHTAQGNTSQALESLQKALELSRKMASKLWTTIALNSIGIVHHRRGNYDEGLKYFQDGLKLAQEIEHKNEISRSLTGIADINYARANYNEALDHYRKALKLVQEIGFKINIFRALYHIAKVHYAQNDYAKAIELADQAAAIAAEGGNLEHLWETQTIAGKAHRALNHKDQAQKEFAEAITAVEKLRSYTAGDDQQRRFFEGRISPYREMIALLVERNDAAGAFAHAERAKGRALLDILQSGKVNVTKAMTSDEQLLEQQLEVELASLNIQIQRESQRREPDRAQLAGLRDMLEKARLKFESFQSGLYVSHPELNAQRAQMQPLSVEQAGNLIPDANTALLEFVVTQEKTYLFVVSREQTRQPGRADAGPVLSVHTLDVKRDVLAERVNRFRRRLANIDYGYKEDARQLHEMLLGPARRQLRGRTRLVIVPDSALWELPFQALLSADSRHLIEDYAVSYAPSLTVLREMMRSRAKRPARASSSSTLLALGDPAIGKETAESVTSVFLDEKLGRLPETERQVKTLGKLYGAARSKIYVGADAREDRIKTEANDYQIVHIAAHGVLNDKSPMYSHVVLSQPQDDESQDGLLEAWEIIKLDLKADLVVLSACETARGRIGDGEGMIGLTWALFVAGAPSAVVSQWKVESGSTTELMLEFHRNLRSQKSKAEALRRAALSLLKTDRYLHPFYWAGFVLMGDGR